MTPQELTALHSKVREVKRLDDAMERLSRNPECMHRIQEVQDQ